MTLARQSFFITKAGIWECLPGEVPDKARRLVLSNSNEGFQSFAFAGGLYDEQTKITRFGARDYDSETGRCTCLHPLKLGLRRAGFERPILFGSGISNLYEYCVNDAVNT